MNPFDATHVTGLLSERRSRLDVDEPGGLHSAITPRPDLLVQHLRPIVADLVGSGRMGLGTLLAPADPMVIIDGLCYRLDAGMSAYRTFGGPILEISIENVELKIVAPRVVYQARTGEQATTLPATAGSGC